MRCQGHYNGGGGDRRIDRGEQAIRRRRLQFFWGHDLFFLLMKEGPWDICFFFLVKEGPWDIYSFTIFKLSILVLLRVREGTITCSFSFK